MLFCTHNFSLSLNSIEISTNQLMLFLNVPQVLFFEIPGSRFRVRVNKE